MHASLTKGMIFRPFHAQRRESAGTLSHPVGARQRGGPPKSREIRQRPSTTAYTDKCLWRWILLSCSIVQAPIAYPASWSDRRRSPSLMNFKNVQEYPGPACGGFI